MKAAATAPDAASRREPEAWLAPAVLLATCGWLGRARPAPGTWGSALGICVSVVCGAAASRVADRLGDDPIVAFAVEACLIAGLCLVGIPICTRAARLLGRGKDPGAIVFDEMAAMPLALVAVPPAGRTAPLIVVAFLLFRFFDVSKLPPARQMERLPEGLGIMADDWAAAGWTAVVVSLVRGLGWA